MTVWFNPGVGTAYVGATTVALIGAARVDPRVAVAVRDGAAFEQLMVAVPHAETTALTAFDPADAALRIATRGTVVVEVDGRPLAANSLTDWTVRRLLIDSEAETEIVAALDRRALGAVGRHRLDRGVVPAAALRAGFGPLDESTSTIEPVDAVDALLCPTTVDRPSRRAGRIAVAPSDQALGVLVFSTGERVLLDRTVVLGRNPHPARRSASTAATEPRLVRLRAPGVSRQHAIVHVDGRRVTIDDLGSANGTRITSVDSITTTVVPGVPRRITPGTVVELGDGVSFALEHVA